MGTIIYELKDHLNHHKYDWPLSLVRYPLQLESGEAHPDGFDLRDEEGYSVPVQITGVVLQDGFVISGELVFLTDLPTGASRRYELHYRSSSFSAERNERPKKSGSDFQPAVCGVAYDKRTNSFGNGLINVAVPLDGTRLAEPDDVGRVAEAFGLSVPKAGELAKARVLSKQRLRAVESQSVSSGSVMHEQRILYEFEDGSRYTVLIRLIAGMPYIELEEQMENTTADAGASLEVVWEGLNPVRRYTRFRGEEAIDAYLGDEGEIPFRILPYDNMRSWHRCRTAAFIDEGKQLAAGVMHGDALKWNDGEYALWRSSDTMAIRFYYVEGEGSGCEHRLHWSYPLASGTRETKIAIYDTNRKRAADISRAFRRPGAGEGADESQIDELALWHVLLSLDKVKDWVLDWEEPQEQYPLLFNQDALPEEFHWWYFDRHVPPQPSDVEEIIEKLSYSFNEVGDTGPVTSREFASWVPLFDLSASAMKPEQFRRFKAASALMAYVREDEYVAPIHTMLAGHPNFLVDFKAVPGFMAALFPHHPHAKRWMEHFEKSAALNLKYHTRPAVTEWGSEGGRWTENLGCYVWAALVPMIRTAWCLRQTYGESPLLYPNLVKLAGWLLNTLSAPLAGGRSYPPQGAHSGAHHDPFHPPYVLRLLGELLLNYDPLLAEQLLAVCPVDAAGFESKGKGDIWRLMLAGLASGNSGTPPQLQSVKYTGYGFVLRSAAGTPGEMSVYLQQIDEGPNYRWGRSGNGGNGVIYYYAEGKRYSYNRPEDVGDDNMGTGEGSSSFAVLSGHEYLSIGRNELTSPLYDFGFAQFATLEAGPDADPMYRSRSVIMSGNDYILIYDEVADIRVRGRFSWFTHRDEEFPGIYQLKPGVPAADFIPGAPVDVAGVPAGEYKLPNKLGYPAGAKGKYYDGFGNFLTVVTHRGIWQPQVTEVKATGYGAVVSLAGRTDYLFRDASRIRYDDGAIRFNGYAGIVRMYGSSHFEAALFQGSVIGAGGIVAKVNCEGIGKAGAFAFAAKDGVLYGQSAGEISLTVNMELSAPYSAEKYKLYVNGARWETESSEVFDSVSFRLPAGQTQWQWTDRAPAPTETVKLSAVIISPSEAELAWSAIVGADRYQIAISQDGCGSWRTLANDIGSASYRLTDLQSGTKLHVKVRAANGEVWGQWSAPYPIYATDSTPAAPEGLRLTRTAAGVRATWGRVLGAHAYRLYRCRLGEESNVLIYNGSNCIYEDSIGSGDEGSVYAYSISAANGNGEGQRSLERDTRPGGLIDWDPRPAEGFRRYIRSHEYGFNGFDYWNNEQKDCLPPYPQC